MNHSIFIQGKVTLLAALLFLSTALPLASFSQTTCNPTHLALIVHKEQSRVNYYTARYQKAINDYKAAKKKLLLLSKQRHLLLGEISLQEKTVAKLSHKRKSLLTQLSIYKKSYSLECSDDPNTTECQSLLSKINNVKHAIATVTKYLYSAQKKLSSLRAKDKHLTYQIAVTKKSLKSLSRNLSKTRYQLIAAQKRLHAAKTKLAHCCKTNSDYDNDGYDGIACGGTDCNDNNASVYPGAPELCGDGIDNDCDGEIDETDLTVSAGDCEVSYYGYAPEQGADLTATPSGGSGTYTYAWSTGETTQSISVDPASTTSYTVTVTDSYGCTASARVTVQVVDVRCGKKNNKVNVCHSAGKSGKTKQLCISSNAVKAHLKHGDRLGDCSMGDPCGSSSSISKPTADHGHLNEGTVSLYPNPANGELNIKMAEDIGTYEVLILDGQGRTVMTTQGNKRNLALDVSGLESGMYFVIIQSEDNSIMKRLSVTH